MPATRLTMRKIREVLRLALDCQLTKRQIATSCSIARSTASEYLMRFAASGLGWPLPPEIEDAKLEALLFPPAPPPVEHPREPPDFVELNPKTEILQTGIKVIDLLCPFVRGGKIGLFGGAGVGKTQQPFVGQIVVNNYICIS